VQEYAQRLSHYVKLELVELPPARKGPPDRARAEEADAILGKKTERDWLLALDERGELLTSVELSQLIGEAQRRGRDLLLAIGGDEGLDERVRTAAQKVVSLSKMTLPHRLARLILVEQLYRAFTLLRGEPYHK
jgi:23S rRNA (pseudouridine1915-N3)-methyltransferase